MDCNLSEFAVGITNLYQKLNSFNQKGPSKPVLSLVVNNKKCGLLYEKTASVLAKYPDVFQVDKENVTINPKYTTADEITQVVRKVLEDIREKKIFYTLDGWRNEEYCVKERFSDPMPLFRIERSAASLFGITSYGSHINGYVKKNGEYFMWIARRSKTKPTFPGLLDNFTAGGLTAGLTPLECAQKELEEEAGVNREIASRLKMVDAIMYAYSKNDYINREAEFVFDIKLPEDFKPVNMDGEVEQFYFMNIEEVKMKIISDEFKPNSAAVTLNFLMRKGLVTSNDLPNYLEILENFHAPGC